MSLAGSMDRRYSKSLRVLSLGGALGLIALGVSLAITFDTQRSSVAQNGTGGCPDGHALTAAGESAFAPFSFSDHGNP